MLLDEPGGEFALREMPKPTPAAGEALIRVHACGVCRTDLHVVDGDIRDGRYPIVPGHQIVGIVEAVNGVETLKPGMRVGVPWLGYTCGACAYCRSDTENLCDTAEFTGYQRHGGYADYTVADARYCFALPEAFSDLDAAPLLCAGLIGYRALTRAGEAMAGDISGVAASLGIAFNSTFVALFVSLVLMLFSSMLQGREERLAANCKHFVSSQLIARLSALAKSSASDAGAVAGESPSIEDNPV